MVVVGILTHNNDKSSNDDSLSDIGCNSNDDDESDGETGN